MDEVLANWNSVNRSVTFVGIVEEGSLDVSFDGEDGNPQFTSGITLKIVHDLQYMLHFTFTSIIADDFSPETGVRHNKTVAHYLMTGEADMAIGFLYFISSRLQYGTVMTSLSIERFYAYFIQPKDGANRLSKPFQVETSLALYFVLLFIGWLCAFVLDAIPNDGGGKSVFRKLHEGYLWSVATLSQQAYSLNFAKTSTQIFVSIGVTLSVYLYTYYSATLITYFLTDSDVIQSFDDIFKHKFSLYAIPSVNSTLLHRVKNIKFAHVDYEESIKRVFTRGHVHLDTADLFSMAAKKLRIPDNEVCMNTSRIFLKSGDIHAGFYSRKGFLFKDLFNSKLLKIRERGLSYRYLRSFAQEYVVECQRIRKQYDDDLGLEELSLLFSSIFGCMGFVVVELCVEIFVRKRMQQKELKSLTVVYRM